MHLPFPAVPVILGLLLAPLSLPGGTFRVATYNVENFLDAPAGNRRIKPPEARAKVREAILAARPDILAVQEMGSTNALLELRDNLAREGLSLPHWEYVRGWDTNIHVAVLSRFPFTARRPHTRERYLVNGRRFSVSRGFAEVEIQVRSGYRLTLLCAHLKSKRPLPEADQAEMREEEARLLRRIVDERLQSDPDLNLVVVGDLNDTKDSMPLRLLRSRGNVALVDTRPAERNGDNLPAPRSGWDPRQVTWTYFYGKEDSYQRIDYILISRGLAREWLPEESFAVTVPNWGAGSDHRPIVATFRDQDL